MSTLNLLIEETGPKTQQVALHLYPVQIGKLGIEGTLRVIGKIPTKLLGKSFFLCNILEAAANLAQGVGLGFASPVLISYMESETEGLSKVFCVEEAVAEELIKSLGYTMAYPLPVPGLVRGRVRVQV